MSNLLNAAPDDLITRTANGVWRRYSYRAYHTGATYSEFTSHRTLAGRPLIQIANGHSPETGNRQRAAGGITIGHFAGGIVAAGQFALGLLAGAGQTAMGYFVLAPWGAGIVGRVKDAGSRVRCASPTIFLIE